MHRQIHANVWSSIFQPCDLVWHVSHFQVLHFARYCYFAVRHFLIVQIQRFVQH